MAITLTHIQARKAAGEKICMVTAYDYTMARLCSAAGADILLVGDSLGMVMLGYPDTVSVTMDDMIHHSRAVARGADGPFVLTDMPFMSVRTGHDEAMRNAGRLMAEGRANGVKIEGGRELAPLVSDMVRAGIPVMAHLGLTPQSVNALGGYRVQAKARDAAERLVEDAIALDEAGAFGIVLECVPDSLAALVTRLVQGVTIGIGAGAGCDGQVLVLQDLLGMYTDMTPKFVRRFADAGACIREGVSAYCAAVRSGSFPTAAHSFTMDAGVCEELAERWESARKEQTQD